MEKNHLSFKEFCEYTGFSESFGYKLTSQRKIPFYQPTGRKIFFKREEVDAWLLRNRIKTSDELDIEASTYATTH
jgi:excisionase family DNA binding protein